MTLGNVAGMSSPWRGALAEGWTSAGYEYQPARNLPAPQLLQDFVDLRQWVRGRLAADFSCGSQGQYFSQVLSRADGRRLNPHLQRGHLDRRKA